MICDSRRKTEAIDEYALGKGQGYAANCLKGWQ